VRAIVEKIADGIYNDLMLRIIRDLTLAVAMVRLICWFRKVYCLQGGHMAAEDLEFFRPYQRMSLQLAHYIYEPPAHS